MKVSLSVPFLRLWIGSTASGLATWALPFVLGLVTVKGTITATELGIALAARTVGFLIAVPVGGILSDRMGPRRVILVSSLAGMASVPLIIAGLFGSEPWTSVILLLGAIVVGMGQGACRPAYQAIVPEVVSIDGLQAANAAMSISVRVTSLAGPAAVSFLAIVLGTEAALSAIAVLWLVSATIPPQGKSQQTRDASQSLERATFSFFHEFLAGAQEAKRHPWFIAGLAALTTVIATGYSVTAVLVPGISQEVSGGATLMTATATAYMIGALAGAVLVTRWRPVNTGWTALVGLSLYGLVPFSLLIADYIAVPITAFFVAGVGIEIFNVPWFTAIQKEIPRDRLSRVSSLDFLFSYGLAPAGLSLMTPLASAFGRDAILAASGVICLAGPVLAMCVRTTRHFSTRKVSGSHGVS
ncbi:MFS transporter [Agrobacterium sp. T29]|uniref:MFS transporter n=1 Tax=Agrobacterium sp. T29 TaxID=2580515 RepID=UPI00143D55BC|nr:MFS transporter [Agrobacterium sp. T29]